MKIHIVKAGDSPYSIANMHKADLQNLIKINGLDKLPHLTIGQAIIVPGVQKTYTIRPGDTLWTIAKRHDVSSELLQSVNNIKDPTSLRPGQRILIPDVAKKYGTIESNGFIQPSTREREVNVINEAAPFLTYVSPFSYRLSENGNLIPLADETIINTAAKHNTSSLLSVSNINSTGAFDTKLIDTLLNDTQTQNNLINNVLSLMQSKGYIGVIFDFERISPENRDEYNRFLENASSKIRPTYLMATALAPKTYDITEGSWHGAHDYRAHGRIVDFVIIMTYEWGWSGGPPMAVSPLNEVKKVIDYAVSVIPPRKIMMGIPLYGYDWTLPYIPGGEYARALSFLEATELAARRGSKIQYDMRSKSPYFNYYDNQKRQHVVWFEDARSLFEKYKMVSDYNLRGVSYWALGKTAPQAFYLLDNMFNIRKL